MANDSFKIKKSLNIEPIAGVAPTAEGDVAYDSTAHKASIHNGTTASPLVTAAHTETLTNKTISGASNTISNIALDSQVSNTLPIGNGGTGQTTQTTAFDALQPMTTSGDTIYGGASGTGTRLPKGSDGQVYTLVSGLPAWANIGTQIVPTMQVFLTGSGTYTTPTSPPPLYIEVEMVGGGGGGGGSGVSAGTGGNGGDTTFDVLTASGGTGASWANTIGGPGGAASLGVGPIGVTISGGSGASGSGSSSITGYQDSSGCGGCNPFGGFGAGTIGDVGSAAVANTGGGGSGGGGTATSGTYSGGGGGAGGYLKAIISTPAVSYSYSVGASGAGGTAGTAGFAAGAGGEGKIIVREIY